MIILILFFTDNFLTLAIEDNVGKEIKNLIDNVPFKYTCSNFNLKFFKNLFICLRIIRIYL